jgi:hypothetical protein
VGFCRSSLTEQIPKRGVKSTKFAITGAKRKRNLSHTVRNYSLEISYGSHSKLLPTPIGNQVPGSGIDNFVRALRLPVVPMKRQCRSVNRNCCLGIWNLYFVFQFPNRRARRVSWILHGDIWILKSVHRFQKPGRGAESGFWMARAGSWKLVTVPPCVFEPVPLLSFFLRLGNSESWKVETAITLPVERDLHH